MRQSNENISNQPVYNGSTRMAPAGNICPLGCCSVSGFGAVHLPFCAGGGKVTALAIGVIVAVFIFALIIHGAP